MCEHGENHSKRGFGCMCESEGCGHSGHGGQFMRRYETKAERVTRLESYLGDLKAEIQAVEERLSEVKKG
jgi:hypothetical protein